jgi:hypothetical protein
MLEMLVLQEHSPAGISYIHVGHKKKGAEAPF